MTSPLASLCSVTTVLGASTSPRVLALVLVPSQRFTRREIHSLTLWSDISVYCFSSPMTLSSI